MQQLQSLYRGDSSPSLAQIFGMQYQPQQAISQAANTAVGSGMSAGAQVKTTAMNNATQMAIADANRFENKRQFNLTNRLYNRNASENERHNLATEGNADRVTDWNTGGAVDSEDKKAQGVINSHIAELQQSLDLLDKNDPKYAEKVAMIKGRIKTIMDGASVSSRTRGGLSGFATGVSKMYSAGSFTTSAGNLLTAVPAAPKTTRGTPVGSRPKPNEIAPDHVVKLTGEPYELPSGIPSLFTGSSGPATLSGALGVIQRSYQGQGFPLGMTGTGQPITGTITQGAAAPAAVATPAPAVTPPAVTPESSEPALWPDAATGGSAAIAPTTLAPAPAANGGIVTNPIKLPDWFNPAGI